MVGGFTEKRVIFKSALAQRHSMPWSSHTAAFLFFELLSLYLTIRSMF